MSNNSNSQIPECITEGRTIARAVEVFARDGKTVAHWDVTHITPDEALNEITQHVNIPWRVYVRDWNAGKTVRFGNVLYSLDRSLGAPDIDPETL